MYLADYHMHTRLSPDSSADAMDMAAASYRAGASEICFTDHVDLLDAGGCRQGFAGWQHYLDQFHSLSVPGLTIRLGVELGEGWEDPELARMIVSHPQVDFVIGSVHNLDLRHNGTDLYFIDYSSKIACYDTLKIYMDVLERQANEDTYDVIGHIIYPLRYMNGKAGNHVRLDPFFSQLERIFRTVIAKGKGIEVNTCRGKTVEDWRSILALYKDCGGEIVTLGADAHAPQHVCAGLKEAAGILKEFGLPLAVYEKRQPRLIRL